MTKVKAHRARKVIEALPAEDRRRAELNVVADLGAKAAAEKQMPDSWRVTMAKDKLTRAKRALEYVAFSA